MNFQRKGKAAWAQEKTRGVLRGVQVAELEGHVSRSAVYLIHLEVRTGAWRNQKAILPSVYR